ncbi:hypothetical protein [Parachitinimonas caeni]|uniref:DUF4034 domain-containing protein n=1 Tax=Parachitinimonas caeni TaxID=3031301 RepID=A0ABT7DRR1_9NEIS|nr:hypothetical protein [Parachitinimonas caeni]MDK2122763.1 hypothetical protein [Parachitinimonas caeni]
MKTCLRTARIVTWLWQALWVAILITPPCAIAESDTEIKRLNLDVRYAFENDDFAKLEKMYAEYLTAKTRTQSGGWMLDLMHAQLERILRADLDPGHWQAVEKKIAMWRKRYPRSTLAPLFLANVHLRHAWTYRGDEFIDKVDPAAFKYIRLYLDKSYDVLAKNPEQLQVDPFWYVLAFKVMKMSGTDEKTYDKAVQQGIKKFPDYHPLYLMAAWFLEPKWGGSWEKIDQLALRSIELSKPISGNSIYTRIYWNATANHYGHPVFFTSRIKWPLMKQGFEDILAKYPHDRNRNAYAYFSCIAVDYETLRKILPLVGENIIYEQWGSKDGEKVYKDCVTYAKGGTNFPEFLNKIVQSLPTK